SSTTSTSNMRWVPCRLHDFQVSLALTRSFDAADALPEDASRPTSVHATTLARSATNGIAPLCEVIFDRDSENIGNPLVALTRTGVNGLGTQMLSPVGFCCSSLPDALGGRLHY